MMESEANEHCSKTEQQKKARLDRRNAKDIEPEEALNQQNNDGQGLHERDRSRACNSKVIII